MTDLIQMGRLAKQAASKLALASSEEKNQALRYLADELNRSKNAILEANQQDVKEARDSGMDSAMLDRLNLEGRIEGIAADLQNVIALSDPVREVFDEVLLDNGLKLSKMRTPIGVLGVIYEARPNVTIDIAALSIKTGNSVILRGGSETLRSNRALVKIIQESLTKAGLPAHVVQLIDHADRKLVLELLHLNAYVDMIIPRGGAGLHQFCRDNSSIPVITGGIGICHLFVDETADLARSLEVIYNAKTQRPTVCNALDTLLVHTKVAADFIPKVVERLSCGGVSFRLDEKALSLVQAASSIQRAGPSDWDIEWLSLILGIKVVKGVDEAIAHISAHSTGHSDGILTETIHNANRFINEVDSAAVYVNASTRFTDGAQFGLGAEVAISTQKLHARGPMGLRELTTYKWVVQGDYQTRKS